MGLRISQGKQSFVYFHNQNIWSKGYLSFEFNQQTYSNDFVDSQAS